MARVAIKSLHTIKRSSVITFEFYQKTRITLVVVNILINYRQSGCDSDGSMWKREQLNRAAVVRGVMSLAEPREAVLGVQ